jgi:hypothetical protein
MARKRSPDSTSDRQRIQFAYNADRDTPIGEVFQYLLKSDKLPNRKGKHKGLDAIAAFWQPFACLDNRELSETERRAIALDSIDALTKHIHLIQETFGLESSSAATRETVSTEPFKQEIRAVVTEVMQAFLVSGASSAPAAFPNPTHTMQAVSSPTTASSASTSEGVDFDEDALLGGLFDSSEIAA